MKRFLVGLLMSAAVLVSPAALFAQSDGGVEPVPSKEETPQPVPVETPLPREEAPVTEPAALAPEPVPDTTLAQVPAPPPRPAPPPPIAAPTMAATTSTPASEPLPLEEIQELFETVAEEVPAPLQPWLYAIAGALGAVITLLGIQAWLKNAKKQRVKSCAHCEGTGHEKTLGACVGCKGTGKVEEEHEATVKCPHCGGEGEEPCEVCGGEGAKDGKDCGPCDGSGSKKDENGENLECEGCDGEGETSVTLKREVTCPDCDGEA